MKLCVYVLEAKGLRAQAETYVKLKVGKYRSRTRMVSVGADLVWNEEFVFRMEDAWEVGDGEEEEADGDQLLTVRVFSRDQTRGGIFGGGNRRLLGRVDVWLSTVFGDERRTLPPTWFPLRRQRGSVCKLDCGKILLTMSLHGKRIGKSITITPEPRDTHSSPHAINAYNDSPHKAQMHEFTHQGTISSKNERKRLNSGDSVVARDGRHQIQTLAGHFIKRLLHRNEESCTSKTKFHDQVVMGDTNSDAESNRKTNDGIVNFGEAIQNLQLRDKIQNPDKLQRGVLLQHRYAVSSKYLNMLLFEPNSQFRQDLAEIQGTSEYKEEPWMCNFGDNPSLTRVVTYRKAATKLVKAVTVSEEQAYLKADGEDFTIFSRVFTPDAPYGNCFHLELMYRIIPGQELSSHEPSSQLIVSWDLIFSQSTLVRSIIEEGIKQGLEESFGQFADFLSQKIRTVESTGLTLDKNQILASLQLKHRSDWQLAVSYLWNFTFVSTVFMVLYVFVHIILPGYGSKKSLEFGFLDLPDTLGELITSGVLFFQGRIVFKMISRFIRARVCRGSDHGLKAQGHGWLLTVALLEGTALPSVNSTRFSAPYVVFFCNGKTRTSSVQLETVDPQWNEILEFDAMQEPPSILTAEVFGFDGPSSFASSLGHAEINFLKQTSEELADMWVSLNGKLGHASNSLHLRIFLRNTNGTTIIKDYLSQLEKEVGKKIHHQSPHRNSMFQRIFGLPEEEFLINHFSCHLKRMMPVQGRLFLSIRIVGFYSNVFGYRTNFFFLWEDIEDIQEIPSSFATIGSQSLLITLRKDRGLDARHGAKTVDEEGRLQFQFQSFASFNAVRGTIMALWKARTLNPDKYEVGGSRSDPGGDSSPCDLSKVYSAEVHVNMNSLLMLFGGGPLEKKIMEKVGCLNYTSTAWEPLRPDSFHRTVNYKLNHQVSIFGGEVTSKQRRTTIPSSNGWAIDETMAIRGVPFGSHFRVLLRYQVTPISSEVACRCDILMGIIWTKGAIFERTIAKNVHEKLSQRSEEVLDVAQLEIGSISSGSCG
ncbi:unnamed protein product [Spirodela intermedia]|uniref:Uncharacterized protein n=1 Tax=Spirodela intermedia TaxID=51605 RepID=A0A7I8L4A1_SPIIN|nr:unnamed protein product [Spirodela intermedia]